MLELQELNIKDMIYTIRGQQVMLDSDLAKLYGYEVKRLNEQVKRNIERFPSHFMFQLSKDEMEMLSRSHFATPIQVKGLKGGRSYKIYAFSEQGIYMLATILKGELAVKQSILIMETFKEMRHYILENQSLIGSKELAQLAIQINKNTNKIVSIENTMATKDDNSKIMDKFIDASKIKEFVFVDGQKFEADEAYIKLYKLAKQSIYVVDDYVSIKTLSHLKQVNDGGEVTLFTDNKAGRSKLTLTEVNDFIVEHYPIVLYETNGLIHDRLIVLDYGLDSEKIYLCGASSKDAGAKFCTILEVRNTELYYGIINKLLSNELLTL